MDRSVRELLVSEQFGGWWSILTWPHVRFFIECRLCGTSEWGLTRRHATRVLLAHHVPDSPECRERVAEQEREGREEIAMLEKMYPPLTNN
jgi:hypothetical protein